jgi:hypothetical protein
MVTVDWGIGHHLWIEIEDASLMGHRSPSLDWDLGHFVSLLRRVCVCYEAVNNMQQRAMPVTAKPEERKNTKEGRKTKQMEGKKMKEGRKTKEQEGRKED